ncbi:DUF4252 domain-containing protein [Christiangramia flava]|uniref:Uncharacterized protein n=1 Tax=Christiangramia flava JLT2011 TaxID=1229726 RepID=A0A1L7I7Y1_9FLAO|nr:DUF4252 domain-containing protein [Christiangramia flava]APU69696.1 hypothetical protein GRFL_2972 [Christiangramia flava JLT2011]OSS39273.1 hypothetical protein C723_1819 [Christiangramia flava JLT2011]
MTLIKKLTVLFSILAITACQNDKSIQKYYVDNQEDADFMALDVPTSMFANLDAMDAEKRETMESIKKINVLALRADQHPEKFKKEKAKLDEIFTDEKYQLLMKYGGGTRKAALYFTGEDDAIDELIVYGYDDSKGLGVARVLGEDMNPAGIMEMMKSLKKEDIDASGLEGLIGIMGNDKKTKDSTTVKSSEDDTTAVETDSISE